MNQLPPESIQNELAQLQADLDLKIPSKKLDKNLLIATWNIRSFGNLTKKWISEDDDSPKRDYHSILLIAEILKRFDVVAIQEVTSNLRALRHTLKLLGDNYSVILTDVNKGSSGNNERMAYIFDTRRVQLSGLACELVIPEEWEDTLSDSELKKQFVRSPYAVSFKANNQTFILVTLHILYGKKSSDRIKELRGIAKWMSSWANNINKYHHNLITLGDFNIDKRGDLLNQTFMQEGLFIPDALADESVLRSIFDETKYYDQIAWFQKESGKPHLDLEFISGGHYDFMPIALKDRGLTKRSLSFMISDHFPLWAEFKL